jgi:hypothetical protein
VCVHLGCAATFVAVVSSLFTLGSAPPCFDLFSLFDNLRQQRAVRVSASLGGPDAAVKIFPQHCRSFVAFLAQRDAVSCSCRSGSSYRDSCRPVSASGLGRCAPLLSSFFVPSRSLFGAPTTCLGRILVRAHSFSLSLGFSRRCSSDLCAARISGLPGGPCHRFGLVRFRFLVRLLGSINRHRFITGLSRFGSGF